MMSPTPHPLGALTSKPYAFVARPWELETVEGFDFFDSLGSPLSLGIRGGELLRVLPRSSSSPLREGWLADRTRFSYDALRRQRLAQPLSKFIPSDEGRSLSETETFHPVDWPQALGQLAILLEKAPPLPLVGSFFSLESALSLRRLLLALSPRWAATLWHLSPPSDSRSSFLLPQLFSKEVDLVVLVALAPRLQLPLLNLHLRRLAHRGVPCFAFGGGSPSTFPLLSLGSSPSQLVRFLEGRHRLSVPFSLARRPLLLGDPSLSLPPFQPLFSTLSPLQLAELAVPSLSPFFPPPPSVGDSPLLWLFEEDGVAGESVAGTVYQGSHGDRGASLAQLILPTPSPFEAEQTAYDCSGSPVSQRSPLTPPSGARPHWAILEALRRLMVPSSPLSPFPPGFPTLPTPLPLSPPPHPRRLPRRSPSVAPLSNHYLGTAFSRSSAAMALASSRFTPSSSFYDHG